MKHYGDITKINGATVPPVDVVVGGSPCQDLSIAGKRAGLDGERSGLFMEQIRIIKEMRAKNGTNDICGPVGPRFMVWENVPGAFSSNNGEDFRAVLEETARIADPGVDVPRLPDGVCWAGAGCILGDRWAIAWRTHDAQFWGVPQRRRRIALVADFGGQTAPQILFEREGMPGNPEQGRKTRQGIARNVKGGIDETTSGDNRQAIFIIDNHPQDGSFNIKNGEVFPTMGARQGAEGDPHTLMILENKNVAAFRKTSHAQSANDGQGWEQTEVNDTLNVFDMGETRTPTLISDSLTVRRLTPLECERLQGFPDGWTDLQDWTDTKGKKHKASDAPRYKALGNSIALPFWQWLAGRIVDVLKADGTETPTMASLFDGIGGFPLVFSRCGCVPVWASEIEEFPIAVTKKHFPDETEAE